MAANGPMLDMLRAALTRARSLAAKEVRFLSEGIEVVDALGATRELTVDGKAHPVDVAGLREALEGYEFRVHGLGRGRDAEREVDGHGVWKLGGSDDETLTLKPKKPFPSTLSQVAGSDPDDLALIRSAYLVRGGDVFADVEGETRLRDFAVALVAERTLAGLSTEASLPPIMPSRGYRGSGFEGYEGPDLFDPEPSSGGARWRLVASDRNRSVARFLGAEGGDVTDVWLSNASRYGQAIAAHHDRVATRERPTLAIGVALVKSKPDLKVCASRSMEAAISAAGMPGLQPWAEIESHRAARAAARPQKERTWFPTSEAVGEAFVARRAPRGYVSGRSLYFHGPVAFAVYDRNPVAALVDLPGDRTFLFYGRDAGIGGTLAGTVTSAQGDVGRAAGIKFETFEVGSLTDFLTWGGKRLDEVARRMRHDKNEEGMPTSCTIDVPQLAVWLQERQEAALRELQDARRTTFPTMRKAGAYRWLADLSEMRDTLASALGADLPPMADREDMRRLAESEFKAANERSIELTRQKRAREAEARAEAPATPGFG